MKGKRLLALVPLAATLLGIVGFELASRLFMQPSERASGSLFGIDLPPLRVIAKIVPIDPTRVWYQSGLHNEQGLTIGDLWGIMREDKVTGYTPVENAISTHGWWQSNNIGARSRTATLAQVPEGKVRLLVFGDSYGQGSRVRQEDTWFEVLQSRNPYSEIVNLSVDGFGMGQAFLRYQILRDTLEFDTVVFVFVPEADLWRDINTVRYLAEGWSAYIVLPRFVLTKDQLQIIPGPYEIGTDIYRSDFPILSTRVREHLRNYDRFYIPLLFESYPLIGNLVTYKLIAKSIGEKQRERVFDEAKWDLNSEAMKITRRIFQSIDLDAKNRRERFVLLLLPDAEFLTRIRASRTARGAQAWEDRVKLLKQDGLDTVDLLPDMRLLPDENVDSGYDGSHYGPRTNRALAEIIDTRLRELDPSLLR